MHGFTPGANVDLVARLVADNLRKRLGQPIVVESRPGAGGSAAGAPSHEQQQPAPEDDRLLRLAADFENFKKRAARERQEYVQLAKERLIA